MKTANYKKSFLLFTHIVLGAILTFFTVVGAMNYNRNILLGFTISGFILLGYFLVLKKSASLFTQNSIGGAYFLAISGFIVFAFIEITNCSNSYYWNMH